VTEYKLSSRIGYLVFRAALRAFGANRVRLGAVITDILQGGDHFLSGVHNPSQSPTSLLKALVEWSRVLNRDFHEIAAAIEPSIRQSILMSLVPAQAFDPTYAGSIDKAIQDHLNYLGLTVTTEERTVIRDLCININKVKSLNKAAARRTSRSLADLKGNPRLYNSLLNSQKRRCIWCGVDILSPKVRMSLEHVAPMHLGDDPLDGSNWAIACSSCNTGKAEVLAWPTTPEALDFMGRVDFTAINEIGLPQRWCVLMRSRLCYDCGATVRDTELWIFRRIKTGLPIPVNCSSTCVVCAKRNKLEILLPKWVQKELGRNKPTI